MKKIALVLVVAVVMSGCSLIGATNEDAGMSMFASEATLPANGSLKYEVTRTPRTDPESMRWNQQMGVQRNAAAWFGFGGSKAGNARTYLDK